MNREQVISNALAALKAAENGEEHQYLGYSFKGILHRINFEASFFPSCPIELIPPERRKFGTWQDKEPWKR